LSRRLFAAVFAATLLSSSACDMPRFEGPQIQNPPINFLVQPEAYQQRPTFPELTPAFHTAWVHTDIGGVSAIYLSGYPGAMTLDNVLAGAEGRRETERDPDATFGEIEVLTIDGREAFGWSERIQSEPRGLVETRYRAVIPYDTITYVVEFVSDEPSLKLLSPDTLRVVVASFGIGETTWNLPLIAVFFGVTLLLVSVMRSRQEERQVRHRSINLVQFKKEEPEAKAAEEEESAMPTEGPGPPD